MKLLATMRSTQRRQLRKFSEVAMSSPSTPARFEAYRAEPIAKLSLLELSPSSINTDVRRHGLNPFLTGLTVGIIAFITGFLLVFACLVVSYLQ
jgi:hypothetical protein